MISKLLKILVWIATIITFSILVFMIAYILYKGIPYLSFSLFALNYTSDNVSLFPALITTIMMTVLSLLIAVPIGVGSAIYLVEYANKSSKLVKVIRTTTETLSGIPSIVYGLFGMLFFVNFFGYSLIAGVLTLSIMILPLIMRSSEEALLAVSDTFREGSFGLGAGRLQTTIKIVLPSAANGILAGAILAIGRIVGETAALIYTSGTVPQIPGTSDHILLDSGRTLSVHMYALSSEGFHVGEAYATAVVLLVTVIFINASAAFVAKKLAIGGKNG